jgi:hypothetical protein
MRENRLSGSEGGATSSRPYPYRSSSPFGTKSDASLRDNKSPRQLSAKSKPPQRLASVAFSAFEDLIAKTKSGSVKTMITTARIKNRLIPKTLMSSAL